MQDAISSYVIADDGTRIAWHAHPGDATEEQRRRQRTVILTNGLSSTENFWKYFVPPLVDRYRIVHWNYRGHERSESSRSGDYSIRTHASDLGRVAEEAMARGDSDRSPIHVAFSMGVAVLLELYRSRPDLVGGMVLIGGGADHPYASSRLFRLPGLHSAMRHALRAASPVVPRLSPIVRRITCSKALFPLAQRLGTIARHAPREEVEHFFRCLGDMDLRAYWESFRSLMETRMSDILTDVQVPVLVVAPERDVMALRADLELLHRRLPNPEWTMIPGTGHAVLLEAGEAVSHRVGVFLDRLTRAS